MAKSRFARLALLAGAAAVLTRDARASEDERRQPWAADGSGRRDSRDDTAIRFAPDSYNADTRSIDAILSTGAQVRRFYCVEELEVSPDAIDLTRAGNGLVPLLDSHNQSEVDAVIGTVGNVRIENGQLLGTFQFGQTERAQQIEGMVARGELRGVSIGYRVNTWEIQSTDDVGVDTWRATRWELLEVSIVSVPADANAVVRAAGGLSSHGATNEEDPMKRNTQGGAPAASPTVAAPAAEPTRAIETPASPAPAAAPAPAAGPTRFSAVDAITFVDQARAYNNDALVTRATELVQQNDRGEIGTEAARSAFMQAAAEAQRAATSTVRTGPSAQVTGDSSEQTRGLIVDAIVARSTGGQVPDASREFMGMSLLSIAAARAGISPTVRDADTILRAAGTTSDFPMLLEAAANKVLMARYQSANPTYQAISARRDLRDFKQTKLLRVGDFPTLLPYAEDGEIKSGTINEGRETVILGSYGRKVLLTRQAIVNDDLGAFNDVFGSIGLVVSLFENALFFAMKSSGNGNGPKLSDNKALFDAAHGNLAAAGAAVAIDTLSAGRAAMRKQKNLDGNPLNYSPSIIMVGPDIETAVQQFLAPIQAQQAGNVNPFAGTLQMEVDANIDDNSWELYTSPGLLPAFNYGYLESAPGPRVMTKEGYDHDGISFRVTEDFYAAPVDYRGAYRNPGV